MDIVGPLGPEYPDWRKVYREIAQPGKTDDCGSLPLLMRLPPLATLLRQDPGESRDMPGRVMVLMSRDPENACAHITGEYSPSSAQMFFPVTFGGLVDPMIRGAMKCGKTRR